MSKKIKFWQFTLCILGILSFSLPTSASQDFRRFWLEGDGTLTIDQVAIHFRRPDGSYDEAALKKLHQIMNAPFSPLEERISLRFIEILDYLQDQLHGGSYVLKSGYRSPELDQSLRSKGRLAAKSSMHIEGAAADLMLTGVPPSDVFDYVKSLDCCGIGWYHSRHFHLDSGPSRYWDEKSSKTEDNTPQQNEKIIMQPDYDRYIPGEKVALKFMRVSDYPFGISGTFDLVPENGGEKGVPVKVWNKGKELSEKDCNTVGDRSQGRGLEVKLPDKSLSAGKYALKVHFCNRYDYEKMPEEILSKNFEIMGRR